MKNKRLISFILSLLLIVTTIVPGVALAEESEGVKILSTTPEDGSTGIMPMGATMEVEFNTPIDPATLTTASISSEPAVIAAVVPDSSKSNKCIIYFNALELNTKYKVMFSKQIKSVSGERLQKTDVVFQTTNLYPQHHQIVNGDMENTAHLNMFELAGATKRVISYQKESGNTVLKFDPGWDGAGVGQYVYLEPGKTYEMRAKIKSSTSQMVRMIMSYVSLSEGASNWWHPIVSKTLAADQWVDYTGSVTIPEDLSYDHSRLIRITAQKKTETIYIDDWQFYEVGYDVPMPKIAKASEKTIETYVSAEETGKIEQMIGLGIFEADALEKADMPVSRLDAAVSIGRIAGVLETATIATEFTDLEGIKKRGSAQALVDMGIMKGYGKYFYPNNNISVDEVLEGMVNLLGYGPMATEIGYPAAINKLKLRDGVQTKNGGITYGNFAKILANALDTDVMEDYSVVTGENLLWRALKTEEFEGVVTATEYTDIYGGSKAKEGNIVIDGVSYKVTFDTYGLEGKNVRFFTKEINNENFIMYITEMNTLNNVLKIDWDDIDEYSDRSYVYYNEQNKRKKVTLARDKKVIYNGVALNDYKAEDLTVAYGNVELIDNNKDNAYDIVRVESIDTYVVKSVNHENFIIYDEDNESKVLDLSEAENIIVEENGQKVRFGNIIQGTVVSAAKSKDGSFAKLYISNNKIESFIGSVYGDGTDTVISLYDYIHGEGASKSYAVHPLYNGAKKIREDSDIFIGQSVVVAVDYMGYAVSVVFGVGVTDWQWGYVADARYNTVSFDDKLEFKIFGENGEFSIIPCALKVNVNGTTVERVDAVSYMNGGIEGVIPQLIRFKKNADNEIIQILSTSDPQLRLTKVSGSNLTYSSTLRNFGYKVSLKSTSIPVFAVPSTITSDNEHQFVSGKASDYLVNEKKYTFDAYSVDENELDAEFLVLKDRAVKNPDSWTIGMVMDIKRSVDEVGDELLKITVQNTGSNATAKVYPDRIDINNLDGINTGTGLKLKQGDIVMYQNSPQGVVENMYLLYDHESKTLYTSSNPNSTGNVAYRVVYGKVKERKGDLIRLLPNGAADEDSNYEVYNLSLYSRMLVHDDTVKKPYAGSKADVFDESCGDDSAELVVVSSWGGATLMAVYK